MTSIYNEDNFYSRTELLLGTDAVAKLRCARVAVVGLGAVGSYVVEALARAGVGYLRLVDFDVINKSNLNRQLYALESTIGKSKAQIARKRVLDINPDCVVDARESFFSEETQPDILGGDLDLVVDAIDSLSQKAHIIVGATALNIPVITSMGAALKKDPAKIRVGTLTETQNCLLARKVRKLVRKIGGHTDIPCVYSLEEITEPAGADKVLGSLPTITGMFGLHVAHECLRILMKRK